MAHPTTRARQRTIAIDRLRASCERLAERFGVDAPVIPDRFPRDPSHLPTLQVEAVIGFLDTLNAVEPGSGEADAAVVEPSVALTRTTVSIPKPKRTPSPKPGRAAIRA